jgi:UDP-glucose 4-epimerase
MPKIVVFGGNGFIGKHLVAKLAENIDNDIIVFSRPRTNNAISNNHNLYKNVSLFNGDIFNENDIETVLADGADFVFHLISSTNPATSHDDPLIDIDTNLHNSVKLFQTCVKYGIKKVIFFSSGGTVYGDTDSSSIDEFTVPKPFSPYGINKLSTEHYLEYFKHRHGLDYIVYRIANPYGPGQSILGKQGVIPIFMQKFINHEEISIYGDGSMKRDYIYIDDLVEMIISSYNKANQHPVYNLGSGVGLSVNDIVNTIESCTKQKPSINYAEKPSSYVQDSVLSIDRYVDEFNIRPSTPIETGIKETWNYVCETIKQQ